ncbi:MAG: hypothetical protein IJQ39_15005 [Thermoguttaceae bacterium]|nr:hypothetical protein [Thermoguttaceae bacterium]
MAIPEIDKQYIYEALEYIDKNGVEEKYESRVYDLVTEDGKKYPPKFVIIVAAKLAHGVELSYKGFNSIEANNFLQKQGFTIEKRPGKNETDDQEENAHLDELQRFASMLRNSKNIIFHGAPGTGKTYLAREISAYIISSGQCTRYDDLSDEQKKQVAFVQFHPSYDYTDFVEGLRPTDDAGTIGFELQDGIFKRFVTIARKNYEDSEKSETELENEDSIEEAMNEFLSSIEIGVDIFNTVKGKKFTIQKIDDNYNRIIVSNPVNEKTDKIRLNIERLRKILESGNDFTNVSQVSEFLMST